nr:translation initiation factor 2 subunit alpha [Andalucia godoyi]|eukprot:ANDGO_02989.mRNA.1 Eukaryotic translation initiation factor 2 subunit alpha
MSSQNFRFYKNQYPKEGQNVVVVVRSIQDMGAYVSLLEYGNVEGMILMSELSRRRIRSISKLIRVGRQEVVQVLRVDPDKGYIDLSKSKVKPEEAFLVEEKFNHARTVQSILRATAEKFTRDIQTESDPAKKQALKDKFGNITLPFLCEHVSWPLYEHPKFANLDCPAYRAFEYSVAHPEEVFTPQLCQSIPDEVIEYIKADIGRKLKAQPIRLRADMNLTCFSFDGIEAIRYALIRGEELANKISPGSVKICLTAPPLYAVTCVSGSKVDGIELMKRVIQEIQTAMEEKKGKFELKQEPKVISEKEEKSLSSIIANADGENSEDDDEDGSDDSEDGSENEDEDDDDEAEEDEDELRGIKRKPRKVAHKGGEDEDD